MAVRTVDTKFSVHVRVDLSLVGIDLGSVGTAVRTGSLQLLPTSIL